MVELTVAWHICPMCGADSPRKCDLEDESDCCPWVESGQYDEDMKRAAKDEASDE